MQVLSVKNARRTIDIAHKGEKVCEMVFDSVIFSGPGGIKEIYELEIELAGELSGIWKNSREIADKFGLKPAPPSKYMLGMELVGGMDSH